MSKPLTVLFIMGTRPEVIKCAPVIQAFQASPDTNCRVCATSEHRTMQDAMMALFDIKADFDLDIMKPNQDLYYLTGELILRLKEVMAQAKPDVVFVQGDTTTSLMGALAAFYVGVPVAHLEAGLRTNDLSAPFPEEGNRQLASRLARWHFTPAELSKQNLLKEGIPADNIHVVGNSVIDALFWMVSRLESGQHQADFDERVKSLIHEASPYVLVTGHRRENFGDGFQNICKAIHALAKRYPDWHFVYPVHLNPNVRAPVEAILTDCPNILLCEPMGYVSFIELMRHAQIILTDSGGVQEEAPSLAKPVLVMRETSERPEGLDAGVAKLVGTSQAKITEAVSTLIDDPAAYDAMARAINPYGDGKTSQRVLDIITNQA